MKRVLHFGYCDLHGKRRFENRKDAKTAIRLWHRRGEGVREYRCTISGWHVGHLPPVVRNGEKTAREVYGARDTQRPRRRTVSDPATLPVHLTIQWTDPQADGSVFPNCLARYLNGWLLVTDLTVEGRRKVYGFPAHTIDQTSMEDLS